MPLPPPPPAALPAAFASISGGVGDGRPCGEEDGAEQTGPGSRAVRWRTCPGAGATLHLPALHVSCPIPPPHRADFSIAAGHFLSGRSLLLSHPFHFSRCFQGLHTSSLPSPRPLPQCCLQTLSSPAPISFSKHPWPLVTVPWQTLGHQHCAVPSPKHT